MNNNAEVYGSPENGGFQPGMREKVLLCLVGGVQTRDVLANVSSTGMSRLIKMIESEINREILAVLEEVKHLVDDQVLNDFGDWRKHTDDEWKAKLDTIADRYKPKQS